MTEQNESNQWFAHWFDSSFYHILYKHRDYAEAALFLDRLTAHLQLPGNAHVLDLACGKGRHSIHLHKLGYSVTGLDLSESSIAEARVHEAEGLQFAVHDMREPLPNAPYNAIFNLFTSFGYFEDPADDQRVVNAVAAGLASNGVFVLDFLNRSEVLRCLIPREVKSVEGIDFTIEKTVRDNAVLKEISFEHEGRQHRYQERVRIYSMADLTAMLNNSGLRVEECFGDYNLNGFSSATASRCILVARPH